MNEYWIVKDRRSGRVVCQCGDINDAIMMVGLDPNHRTYSRHRFIIDQVIDITSTTDKQLPGQIGLPSGKVDSLNFYQEKLPEADGIPVVL